MESIFKTGTVIEDKWVIIEFIGKGAMGEVYRAHQLNLRRDVAIKVISPEMLKEFEDDPEEIETAVERFRREVQLMAQVHHPNVVQIFDYGTYQHQVDEKETHVEYIVMEYIPGATLRYTMSEEGFYPEEALTREWLVKWFFPTLAGIEAIHSHDIAHRDIKPENVLLDGTIPKICDFGIAASTRVRPVTHSIDSKGTPAYMSPEHFFDFKRADRQADIYSLGKIVFEAVSGRMEKILPFKSAHLEKAETPFFKEIDRIVQVATEEQKEKRFDSVAELRKALLKSLTLLQSAAPSPPPTATASQKTPLFYRPKVVWTGIIVAILSMAAMAFYHLFGNPFHRQNPVSSGQTFQKAPAAQTFRGRDGILMTLIPGGEFSVGVESPNSIGRRIQVKPFYMDTQLVTFHHFSEFLNSAKDSLKVENGVVTKDDHIWFYLGEGVEPYEQILYQHGRFHIRNTDYAARPVVRVTWYGASAYASQYGEQLPTDRQWGYAASIGKITSKQEETNSSANETAGAESHGHMMEMMPEPGSQGGKTQERSMKEWAIRSVSGSPAQGKSTSQQVAYPSVVMKSLPAAGRETQIATYPWEAFPDVGFRCVKNPEGGSEPVNPSSADSMKK